MGVPTDGTHSLLHSLTPSFTHSRVFSPVLICVGFSDSGARLQVFADETRARMLLLCQPLCIAIESGAMRVRAAPARPSATAAPMEQVFLFL